MTDNHNDSADGQQCGVCGGRIDAGEGREIRWDEDTSAYVHTNCA